MTTPSTPSSRSKLTTVLRRIPRPSAALLVGLLALAVATTGTAVAASTVVNIADGADDTRVAKVDATGKLAVGDGVGSLTIDGKVTTGLPVPFTANIHSDTLASGVGSCTSPAFTLLTGVPFLLERVVVDFSGPRLSDGPRAALRLFRKDSSTTSATFDMPIALTENGFSSAGGAADVGLLVKGNSFSAAAVGDIYAVNACLNRGSASSGTAEVLLSGRR
jgi:hypothetical protein